MRSPNNQRLSVPAPRHQLPRPLTDEELFRYAAIADALCGSRDNTPAPSACPQFPAQLDVALATRSDAFADIVAALAAAPTESEKLAVWLRGLHDTDPDTFQKVSTVAAGAYLMIPQIKAAVGYPGQRRNPPGPEEAVDEIMDGILDPVLERGHFYVPAPGQERSE